MSELPAGIEPADAPVPRDSASALVLRRGSRGGGEVLMGVRSRRSRFMPGHLAFPGGVVDAGDGEGDGRFLRGAVRELAEETGVSIEPRRWLEAGERTTPAMFPVRFRTVFFVTELPRETVAPQPPGEEIESLRFVAPAQALREWTRGDCAIPPPVLPLLRALAGAEGLPLPELAGRLAETNEREQRAPRIEFTPGFWMLPLRTPTLPPATHTNVWMPGGARFALIDPGSSEADELARLEEVIERRGAEGGRPGVVLLTHHHIDHVGGAAQLARRLQVPLRAHPDVLTTLGDALAGVECLPLFDGDEIDLEGVVLRAVHTPGHAPGHLAFHLPDERLLVAGDLLSGLSTILIDPAHGDMGQYIDSLRRVQALDCRTLLPGHGPPLPGRALDKLIRHRLDREARIARQVRDGSAALARIARAAYEELPEMPQGLIELQTLAHLVYLERQGKVRRLDDAGGEWEAA